jgi:signal transduction histidine kinase
MFAHEVSNPLNSIYTAVQMLERLFEQHDFTGKAATLSIVNDIKNEMRRLQSLLDDFRNLARPAALALQPVDLAVLVRDLIKGTAANFAQAKIEFIENFPAALPLILGDADKLKQALLNLVKNAAEAMPKGGTITITGAARDAEVRLDVADTGSGIPEGSNVFDFFQTTKSGGTGLGLVIVKQIINAHNGSISYTSTGGKGTTFHLTLPAAPAAEIR